jgi:hypothetical protein
MSARELSLKAGLSHGAVSWMLRNRKNGVRESTIKALAEATGCSAAWLLTGDGAPFMHEDAQHGVPNDTARHHGSHEAHGSSTRAGSTDEHGAHTGERTGRSAGSAHTAHTAQSRGYSQAKSVDAHHSTSASRDGVDEPSREDGIDARPRRSESPSTFGAFANYAKIEKTARALAPEVPDWAWEATARTHPLWIGKDPPGAQVIADVARLIMKHRSPE